MLAPPDPTSPDLSHLCNVPPLFIEVDTIKQYDLWIDLNLGEHIQ